eukprot:TRINITY_DN5566_c0_g1_i2.p1 TRINITY_DN5566_c0_g1~~TRINITY_DN5566_c0_g1_i2.p1  ORF type:complete len:518 (-),score=168.81 TRINITY_DN5566_c0_g1_i2:34-1587(-)
MEFDSPTTRRAFKLLVKLRGDPDKELIPINEYKDAIQKLAMDDTVPVDFTKLHDLMAAIDQADKDGNGCIDAEEFNIMMRGGFVSAEQLYNFYAPTGGQEIDMSPECEKLIGRCFYQVDAQGTGSADQSRLRPFFKGKGGVTQSTWINHFDMDQDTLTLDTLVGGIKDMLQAEEVEEEPLMEILQSELDAALQEQEEAAAAAEDADVVLDIKQPKEEQSSGGGLKGKIQTLERSFLRRGLRIGNVFAGLFILTSGVLGFITESISYASVVLQLILLCFGVLVLLLEARLKGLDALLRNVLHLLYFAKGKAALLAGLGVGCCGCGIGGVVLGFCVLVYGIFSYYALTVHRKIGLYFSTTQADRKELIEKASSRLKLAEQDGSKEDILSAQSRLEALALRAETPEDHFAWERAVCASEDVPLPMFDSFMEKLAEVKDEKEREMLMLSPAKSEEPGIPTHSDPAVEPEAVHMNPNFNSNADPVSPSSALAPLGGETELDEDALPKEGDTPTPQDLSLIHI